MGLDVYSRIVVGVPLKGLISFCGIVNDPVTKYNEDTGKPYQSSKPRKAYRLNDGREVTVKYFGGGHLLAALGPCGDDEDAEGDGTDPAGGKDYGMSAIGLGHYESCSYDEDYDRDNTPGLIGIQLVVTGSNRSYEYDADVDAGVVPEIVERVKTLLAEHFGYEGEVSLFVQSVLSY